MLPCSSSHALIREKISAPTTINCDRNKNIGAKNLAIFVTDLICQRLLYETPIFRPNNENETNAFVADTRADGSWLKELHITCIKSPKVICRAVHDATLNNTTRELKNFCRVALLLYYRFKLLKNSTPGRASG